MQIKKSRRTIGGGGTEVGGFEKKSTVSPSVYLPKMEYFVKDGNVPGGCVNS